MSTGAMRSGREVRPAMDVRGSARRPANDRGCGLHDAFGVESGIRGLVFDVPDVLYDATVWRRWLWRIVGRLGVTGGYADFYRRWEADYDQDVQCGRREYAEALHSFLLASGLSWAQVDEVEAAGRIQRRSIESNVRPLSGVGKTIRALVPLRVRLVAWADAPFSSARLNEQLERLGIVDCFAATLTSLDLEATQPAAACYREMLRTLDLPADQVCYVGHDASHLSAARTAGMRTVAFNYQSHSIADYYLTRFDDLLGIIQAPPRYDTGTTADQTPVMSAANDGGPCR